MKRLLLFLFLGLAVTCMGQSYFQQGVQYKIYVSLDTEKHFLHGNISMSYTNNSPDTLRHIFIHQWPNAYLSEKTPLGQQMMIQQNKEIYTAGESGRGFMDSTSYSSPQQQVTSNAVDQHAEIIRIDLSHPLLPGDSLVLQTPFRVKIPNGDISRLGHTSQQYQITQWYPKPAVYDERGWNIMPYLNQGEFYSEFADFDVEIELPKNYVIAATGEIQTPAEIDFMDSIALYSERTSGRTSGWSSATPSTERKIVRITARNVHDFAWFADPDFRIKQTTFELKNSGREVTARVFIRSGNWSSWTNSLDYLVRACREYSQWISDYPYANINVVDGSISAGGGMEYPMITVISGGTGNFSLDRVIAHEVGHNWFYGILANNERAHAWMDEGLNTAAEIRYIEKHYPDRRILGFEDDITWVERILGLETYSAIDEHYLTFLVIHRNGLDQPPADSAHLHSQINYGGMVYSKVGMLFNALRHFVGEEAYDAFIGEYYNAWKFKHPDEKAFWTIVEKHFPDHIHWLKTGVESTDRIDYRFGRIQKEENQICASVIQSGALKTPVVVAGLIGDSIVEQYTVFPASEITWVCFNNTHIQRLVLDPEKLLPEWNRRNNFIHNRSLLPGLKPLDLQFYSGLENPSKTLVFWTPNVRWNNYDKLMLGVNLKNAGLIRKTFEYDISPLYAFGSKRLTGSAAFNLNWVPKKRSIARMIRLGIYAQTFDYAPELSFNRLSPTLRLEFNKKNPASAYRSDFRLRLVNVQRQLGQLQSGDFNIELQNNSYNVLEGRYKIENGNWLNPWIFSLSGQYTSTFSKLAAEWDFRRVLWQEKRLAIRLFGGVFTHNNSPNPTDFYNFGLSGTTDYLFDYYFLGRSDESGIWSHQMFVTDGGFKSERNIFSDNWMTSANVKVPIYGIFGIYGEAALWKNQSQPMDWAYGYGIEIAFVRDFFEIYLPFPDRVIFFESPYRERIRFVLNLDLDDAFWRVSRGFF